jgi:hypothetical protein
MCLVSTPYLASAGGLALSAASRSVAATLARPLCANLFMPGPTNLMGPLFDIPDSFDPFLVAPEWMGIIVGQSKSSRRSAPRR